MTPILAVSALTWLMASGASPAPREAKPLPEYQVKAAFLLNFTRFVEWPAAAFSGPDAPFTVCVTGRDPFGAVLDDALDGRQVRGRPIRLLRLRTEQSPEGCQLLFVADPGAATDLVSRAGARPILTVSDATPARCAGTIIALTVQDRRVRFEVDAAAGRRAGIKLSSKLLAVATRVEPAADVQRTSR